MTKIIPQAFLNIYNFQRIRIDSGNDPLTDERFSAACFLVAKQLRLFE